MAPEILAPVSIEQFYEVARELEHCELVAGQVIPLAPSNFRHGALAVAIARRLDEYVAANRLGVVVGNDTGFILSEDPPTVRGPDVGIVLAPRVPDPLPERFFPGAPDLAVEVLSPGDSPSETATRVSDFLRAGSQAVWIVNPEDKTVTVHTASGALRFAEDESLEGSPPLPGFRMRVRDLLAVSS